MSASQARYTLSVGANSIDITNDKIGMKVMSMSFMRTIRVPDNNTVNELPPSLGKFPLHKIRDHAQRLPEQMVAKGGAFFPMHQKEAMWIDFTANEPFLVKVYAGGVNVISGEHRNEDIGTKFRRLKDHLSGQEVQDYAVLPEQPWLDGIAVSPGVVRQFVAMPLGKGYSIEAQMTGEEVTGGLQFEITPLIERFTPRSLDHVIVKTMTGKTIHISCSSVPWTCYDLKLAIHDSEGITPDQQRLVFAGKQLGNAQFLTTYGVEDDSVLHLVLKLRGGGYAPPPQMAIAAGGNIRQAVERDFRPSQVWDREMTLTIPVHILNTDTFRRATGRQAPACPITARDYANAGYPFFALAKKPGVGSSDNFGAVKSVNTLDQQYGLASGPEKPVFPRVVAIGGDDTTAAAAEAATAKARRAEHLARAVRDGDGLLSPDGPYRPFRTAGHLRNELDAVDPQELADEAPELMKKLLELRY